MGGDLDLRPKRVKDVTTIASQTVRMLARLVRPLDDQRKSTLCR